MRAHSPGHDGSHFDEDYGGSAPEQKVVDGVVQVVVELCCTSYHRCYLGDEPELSQDLLKTHYCDYYVQFAEGADCC